jgi:Fic family protein
LPRLIGLIERASQALGRLDGMTSILPSANLFVFMYVRKEALLSSQIEGTQSSLSDLLLFENDEAPLVPLDDVQEVSNYIAAMNHGLRRLASGFPLSLRLIREMHRELLSKGRGSGKQPGEIRRSQNWIGGTRPGNATFVPPPPDRVMECLGDLERFLHDRETYPLLIRAALAHVQFETIHPFLDGNGRLGRLLITLMLCEEGALKEPILYLSLYFKTHRARYYDLLQEVRRNGDWEAWLEFFLEGVIETSEQSVASARRLIELFDRDRQKISALGRPAASALRLHGELQRTPLIAVPVAAKKLRISQPTIQKSLDHLQKLGVVREVTGKRRRRLYEYTSYLKILDEGTEPLRR